jgi:hypothetical protein
VDSEFNGYAFSGMTLRDYFAARAMELQSWHNEGDNYRNHADRCYLMADAMVKARDE